MNFQITKNNDCWSIVPMSGRFEGQVVAVAEGVNMSGVTVVARSFVGTLRSVWGMQVLKEEAYGDLAAAIGRSFNDVANQSVAIDFDGVYDAAGRTVSAIQKLVAFAGRIRGKGVSYDS